MRLMSNWEFIWADFASLAALSVEITSSKRWEYD